MTSESAPQSSYKLSNRGNSSDLPNQPYQSHKLHYDKQSVETNLSWLFGNNPGPVEGRGAFPHNGDNCNPTYKGGARGCSCMKKFQKQ